MNSIEKKINSLNRNIKLVEENFRSCLEADGWFPIVGEIHGFQLKEDDVKISIFFSYVGKLKVTISSPYRSTFHRGINFSLWRLSESYDRLVAEIEDMVEQVYLS